MRYVCDYKYKYRAFSVNCKIYAEKSRQNLQKKY
nr:MAG TPA: hypothetical protein [Caudoviricetes sp.]